MQHFKPVISNDASLSGEIITYGCITQISWLQKWTVIGACDRWCIKLRHIPDVTETSLVVRDGNRNRNSSSTFLFSVWIIWGYRVYQRIWTPHVGEKATMVRESGNEHDRFAVPVLEDEMLCTLCGESLVFYWSSRTSLCSLRWWFSAMFPRYRKRSILRELVEVVCNTQFRLSSLSFLNLALLLNSFFRLF